MTGTIDHATEYAKVCQEKPHLLLVDDDVPYTRLVRDMLKGFHVTAVESCKEAIEFLESHVVDGVILDMALPDCDGIELISEIKRLSDAPCVVVTGYGFDGLSYERSMRNGALGFLLKPDSFKDGTFVSRVTQFFQPK